MQRSNSTPACASCKHQRKKCTDKCTLAPFFPVERTREFQAVHKVFGVSNVTKIITGLREEDRKVAVDSLVWEALCRQKDPVLGPFGDYRRVCEELRLYKSQYQHFHQAPNQMYKGGATQGLMGWNNNINNNNNKVMNKNNGTSNNIIGNGNSVMEFCSYGYSPNHHINQDSEKQRENGSAIKPIILPQQHLPNGFGQQYIIAGIYNYGHAKSENHIHIMPNYLIHHQLINYISCYNLVFHSSMYKNAKLKYSILCLSDFWFLIGLYFSNFYRSIQSSGY